ncbi:MAG: alpha/beta hydrolase [Myxococcales bacterium]|nr:alpha/beta hydrolase [Myxococcales bacterium]
MADVVVDGVRLHVQRLGAGRAAVFVHGLVMDNLSSFYFTLATPAAAHRAVALYDLRGHGLSARPATGYALADFVAELAGLADVVSPEAPIDVVGNSFGGLVALAFAAAHPARVASLVLIDAHDGTDGWAAQMASTLGLQGQARDAKIAASFQAWLGRHSERKRTRLAEHARALVEDTTLVADLAASPPLALAALATITAPALLLYGADSDVRARGEALAAALPAATLEIVPGCTHSILWEATALVRARVVAWLEAR